jgi:hypothetical protein
MANTGSKEVHAPASIFCDPGINVKRMAMMVPHNAALNKTGVLYF